MKRTIMDEAKKLSAEFFVALDHDTLTAPEEALAELIQGVRDGSDERNADRIKALEGHRKTWRRLAFRLYDELRKHDVIIAEAIFASEEASQQTSETAGETK